MEVEYSKEIEIGSKVRYIGTTEKKLKGMSGKVVYLGKTDPPVGVEFNTTFSGGHDCDGHCKSKFGWFVYKEDLEVI